MTRIDGHGTITLPATYAHEHVELAYATTEHGAQGHTADHAITLTTDATTGRNLYVGMTRGRATNRTYVATNTNDLSEAIATLETAMAIDRADIPATTHRRALATIARPAPTPRFEIPYFFDELRLRAEGDLEAVRQKVVQREATREDRARRVAAAERALPAAEAAHAPFHRDVTAAREVEQDAHAALRTARSNERTAGRLGRRAARRVGEAAAAIHADATEELNAAQLRAEPTRSQVERLHAVIDRAKERERIDDIRNRWNDLDAAAARASDLCVALDRWRHWADGHRVDRVELAEVVATLHSERLPGTAELATAVCEIAGIEPPNVHRSVAPDVDLGIGL